MFVTSKLLNISEITKRIGNFFKLPIQLFYSISYPELALIGCFIIGLLFGLLERAHVMTSGENALLITGFCGGFTTFSSFADDMWVLGSKGDWSTFVFYLAASVICGVLLVWAGRALIR